MKIDILKNEYWYGGLVTEGIRQPYDAQSDVILNLESNQTVNQSMPLFLSTKGRWLWRNDGYMIKFQDGIISVPEDVLLGSGGQNLRDAYIDAMHRFFPFHPCTLHPILFQNPVYNTWIELTFHQTQKAIMEYCKDILNHGMPSGVLMIDDGWSDYYGKWNFAKDKFEDPESMLKTLHNQGFLVMLWICPFITADTLEYRELAEKGLLVKNKDDTVYIANWWNGFSAVLDMTNPAAQKWLHNQLKTLLDIGVDGFKFDAGDSLYYPKDGKVSQDAHSRAWAAFGEQFPLNEYRVTQGAGGWSLMQRLCDKDHSWGETGLAALVPNAIVQSLTGHPYLCPDMIGGGEYRNFHSMGNLDETLFVRHAQVASLMPVMQFSAAPWRCLNTENYKRILDAIKLREKMLPLIHDAVHNCQTKGEPILRPLSYVFPHENCECITDQFMLGDSCLVAPILTANTNDCEVYVPFGEWQTCKGTIVQSEGQIIHFENQEGPIVLIRI